MSTDELGSGPLMQHAHGARARELGRLGRLLRARAGTIWRDLVRGAISLDCLSSPVGVMLSACNDDDDVRALLVFSLPHHVCSSM